MRRSLSSLLVVPLIGAVALIACQDDASRVVGPAPLAKQGPPSGGGEDAAGNNLSYPVVWAEGVTKVLRVPPGGVPQTTGAWWWWWGIIEGGEGTADVPLACAPDVTAAQPTCLDGTTPGAGAVRAYLQKDLHNVWQAGNVAAAGVVAVDSIDWGDDLEARAWSLSSQVRIEHVLYEGVPSDMAMTEYGMRHLSGWGADESHGLAVLSSGPEVTSNVQPTVFSPCARLTIQRLIVPRESVDPTTLVWDAATHQWVGTQVNAPIFNKAVHEAADGPGYYNAEVNVKGKIIFGYTWGVRKLNQGAGDYRITFSLDAACGGVLRNTDFTGFTTIVLPEEEVAIAAETDTDGGTGVIDAANELTYMDVRITSQKGGGGNKPSGR